MLATYFHVCKGKLHPITDHELGGGGGGGQGEIVFVWGTCTLSLTLLQDGVGDQCHAPAALLPRKRTSTHCTVGWVSPRACLDACRKSCPPPGFDL
jgi:hypothetical protein